MKAEKYFLVNHEVKKNLISRIMDIPENSEFKVTISDAGTKTEKQRNLDYKWDSEIFKSGIGWGDKTVIDVHARSKWLFARPIWLRDCYIFQIIYNSFMNKFKHDKEKCLEFAKDFISTEKFSKDQAWEYMNDKQNFWITKGVNLTDPKDYGLEFYYYG